MKRSERKVIVLGAGPPHRGTEPAPLRETQGGNSVFEWTLDAVGANIEDVTFVAGYHAEEIRERYPDLPIVENKDWSTTGSGLSLLAAPLDRGVGYLVCYGDILVRSEQVVELESLSTKVGVAWDSSWRRRYAGREFGDLERCEKVSVSGGRAVRLGPDIPVDWADGEFIGLVYFAPEVVPLLEDLRAKMPESLRTAHLSGLVEYLRAHGIEIGAIDVAGGWAEVNAPQDIGRFVLGTKAETLRRLRNMVRTAVIPEQVSFKVRQWRDDNSNVLERIRRELPSAPLGVRSSARTEDSFTSANAGVYDSVLDVDPNNGLSEAVERVIASYGEAADDDQILVQPMVRDVVVSGVAFTRTLEFGAPWWVINYSVGDSTNDITSGNSVNHWTLVLRRGEPSSRISDGRLVAVLEALKEVEFLLGCDALDVEFAVDAAGRVHVLQVRPIAVEGHQLDVGDDTCHGAIEKAKSVWRRLAPSPPHLPGNPNALYGVMPDWNPAEIIGTAPGALAESLYRYLIMDEVWAVQRAEFGFRDVRPAPLLVDFAGRPYVDVRASFASFIPAEIPDELAGRLLDFYVHWLVKHPELHDKVEFDVVPTCLAPDFERWEHRLKREGGFSNEEMTCLRNGLRRVTAAGFSRYVDDLSVIERLQERFYVVQSDRALDPVERIRILLDDCRRLGALPFAHLARSAFVAVSLLRGAEAAGIISRDAAESFFSTVRTVSHNLTRDAKSTAAGTTSWDEFVAQYGHLRPGTYEIGSPRYDVDPERFLRPLVEHAAEADLDHQNPGPWHAERHGFFDALEKLGLPSDIAQGERFLRGAIEGREYAKFVFSRNLSQALESIAGLGKDMSFTREEMADIPLGAILKLREGHRQDPETKRTLRELLNAGRAARTIAGICKLPSLVTAESDFDVFVIGSDRPNFVGTSPVTASCVELFKQEAGMESNLSDRIVLIPQADPGYDWLFGQGIAALITQYGGANSHMAIRAAEFGLPAAIGVGELRYCELCTAHELELDPVNQILRVVR